MIPQMAKAIADDLKLGKRVVVVIGTPEDAQAYVRRLQLLGATGKICFLCASMDNGRAWKKQRFDVLHVDDAAVRFERAKDLIDEAIVRCPTPEWRGMKQHPELRRAIRQGRRFAS